VNHHAHVLSRMQTRNFGLKIGGGPTVQMSYKAHKQHHFDGTFCNNVVKKVGGPSPTSKSGGTRPPVPPESYAYGRMLYL
jgi:hypothetical protein